MCLPAVIAGAVSVASTVLSYETSKANNDYQSQIAMNNYNNALEESKRQKQLGIEAQRKEKIKSGLDKTNLISKNAASNFVTSSNSNLYNYDDIDYQTQQNIQDIKNNYDEKSLNYLNQATSYLNAANKANNDNNTLLFKTAINSLGNSKLVNSSWFTP